MVENIVSKHVTDEKLSDLLGCESEEEEDDMYKQCMWKISDPSAPKVRANWGQDSAAAQ